MGHCGFLWSRPDRSTNANDLTKISLSPSFENDRFVSLEAQFHWDRREGA